MKLMPTTESLNMQAVVTLQKSMVSYVNLGGGSWLPTATANSRAHFQLVVATTQVIPVQLRKLHGAGRARQNTTLGMSDH